MGTKADKISMELLSDIQDGRIPLNSRLPTEHELCERFNASRNTVRKAIEWLASEGNVKMKKNCGAFAAAKPKDRSWLNTISVMLPGKFEFMKDIQDMIFRKDFASGIFFQDAFNWDTANEEKFLRQVLNQRHRALLAFCTPLNNSNEKTLDELIKAGIRVVHMDYYSTSLPKGNYYVPDYVRAGRAAATHLMLSGYRKLYFCGYESSAPSEALLSKGFFETLSDLGRGTAEKRDLSTSDDGANYFQLREYGHNTQIEDNPAQFIKKLGPKCGIFCGTKARAAKLLGILKTNKVRVPDDIGVIGVEMLHEYQEDDRSVDYFTFDRMNMFQTAVDEVTNFHFKELHELSAPQMISNGTSKTQP